ncbi:MAG: hypothetical protein QT08_C0008G0032 [archaeon GW2011_AR17]|nr:MAG: hypothetical protein QT08_C0008G0032 [archaeon GW2011_AR17]MBS3153796.1 hypothetical protein [Candidatus Woesearchaeota archaeon]HIH15178.1 hypothetical protein [Nanoarchaeota archaeon]HIH59444.1 hypothetical protein [Nanoarchaeota archaeon]HII13842.1 hypothetical protein [Nanoarchaeota archaeon]
MSQPSRMTKVNTYQSSVGVRLYFPQSDVIYEMYGDFSLHIGETLHISNEDLERRSGYRPDFIMEPSEGDYVITEIEAPTLSRYKINDVNYTRLFRQVTLEKKL